MDKNVIIAKVKKYAKGLVAVAGVAAVVGQALADGDLASVEGLVKVAIAVGVATGVIAVPNTEHAPKDALLHETPAE